MLIDIFKSVANDAVSTTDNQQAAMTKAAKTKPNTEASNQIGDVVLPEDISNDNL